MQNAVRCVLYCTAHNTPVLLCLYQCYIVLYLQCTHGLP
jgi:hypothetical protein